MALDSLPGMVLFVSYSGAFGGAERLLVAFAGAFEHGCCVACPEGELARAVRERGFEVFPIRRHELNVRTTARDRLLAPVRLAAHAAEVRRLARSLQPDLLIAWGMRPAIACLLGPRLPCPVAFQHNDLLPGRYVGGLVRVAARRAAVSIALSQAIAADLDPSGSLGDRLKVVRPGVDVDRFASDGAPADPPEVLVLGAIVDWKRPGLALEACAIARRSHPRLRLRLVGAPLERDGDGLLDSLRARAARADLLGAVEFAGNAADPRADLTRASCLLHCALREPFGMAVLEALAAGRPAVVPAAAGPAEIVDQRSGWLYPPGDAEAAAEALVEVVSEPERAAAIGAAGRERARREFGLAQAQADYLSATRPLLRRSSAAGASQLALITVTRNSAAELQVLLTGAGRHLRGAPIVVVDCDSADATLELARSFESVRVVALDRNVGFGRGCNRGLEGVHEPVTALINPDVELLDDSLAALAAEALREDRAERLLAPVVLYPDGSRQDSVHPVPASAPDLVRSVLPAALAPGPLGVTLAPWRAAAPRRVGWAVGAALVARTETLRRLGPFDERIFLYGEDLDLGLRAAEVGIETWFWPAARVVHHRAHATRQEFGGEPFEALARARHETVARRLGARKARLDDTAQAVTFGSRMILKRALGRSGARERRQLAALRGGSGPCSPSQTPSNV